MSLHRLMRRAAAATQAGVRQALRGVLRRLDATQPLPPAQVAGLAGEKLAAELMQHYGIASAPLAGAEVIVLPIGGASAHGVIIASVDGRYRIQLQPGEVALHTDEGDHVHLKRGRLVEVVTDTLLVQAGTKVRFESPRLELTGDAQIDGNAHADGDVSDSVRSMQADRDIYNAHTHGGVSPGGSNTAPPNQQE